MAFSNAFFCIQHLFFLDFFFSLVFHSFASCIQLCLHHLNDKFFIILCPQLIYKVNKDVLIFFCNHSHDMMNSLLNIHVIKPISSTGLWMFSTSITQASRFSVRFLDTSSQTVSFKPKVMAWSWVTLLKQIFQNEMTISFRIVDGLAFLAKWKRVKASNCPPMLQGYKHLLMALYLCQPFLDASE